MLTEYCQNILKAELSKPDYDGKDASAAWSWLMDSTVTEREEPTNLRLTPLVAAGILGPFKANELALRTKAAIPGIADSLMQNGVNLSDPETGTFLDLIASNPPAPTYLTAEDIATLKALGTRPVTVTTPRRFDYRFFPELWPNVDASGNVTTNEDDPAISGFPNTIERADFNAAWAAAGRNV